MNRRDPKKYPEPGDAFRKFGCTRHVTQVEAKHSGAIIAVHYRAGGPGITETKARISAWRSWANLDCEILQTSECTSQINIRNQTKPPTQAAFSLENDMDKPTETHHCGQALVAGADVQEDHAEIHTQLPAECWSVDDEFFRYHTLGDLIDSEDIEIGQAVYRGHVNHVDPISLIDADDIIEMLGERAYDTAGEAAEDYPEVNDEAVTELNTLLAAWVTKHCQPSFFTVTDVQTYVVTEDDLA